MWPVAPWEANSKEIMFSVPQCWVFATPDQCVFRRSVTVEATWRAVILPCDTLVSLSLEYTKERQQSHTPGWMPFVLFL